MEMISQNAGASYEKKGKRKRKKCTKLKHGRSGDKKKSSPKPNLVEMVSQNAAGEKNNSPKPNLMDDRSAMQPKKEDLESDAAVMALYERWCCYHKINRTPDEMKERFILFKKDAKSCYKINMKEEERKNKNKSSCSFFLFRFSDSTREELWRRPICRPCPPVSSEEMRRRRMWIRRRRLMRRLKKKKLG